MSAARLRESERLHGAVRAFARGESPLGFEALARQIAAYQARYSPAFARLVELHRADLDDVDAIPAVPTDAFRMTRVAVHPEAEDSVRFFTSGTTEATRGAHAMRTTETYSELATTFGRKALIPAGTQPVVVALAMKPTDPPSSSLTFMMADFMRTFHPNARAEWLLDRSGPDVEALSRAAARATQAGAPLLLLATSLALHALVQARADQALPLPSGSVVMQTGGAKGLTTSVNPEELRREAARLFGIPELAVVSEYGMTELTSQLYEGTCPGAELSGPPNVFLAPPWLRVTAVDPVTLAPVPTGQIGLARFVDLGNIDSALAVVTRDRIRAVGAGIELLGREPGAPPRGCSLAVEALLARDPDAPGRR